MKELKNLKTSNNKNLLVVLPINAINKETLNESLYALSMQTDEVDVLLLVSNENSEENLKEINEIASNPYRRVLESSKEGEPKVNLVYSEKKLNYAIEITNSRNFNQVFNEGFNFAIENEFF